METQMAKPKDTPRNPFMDFDMTKMMGDFSAPGMFDMTKLLGEFRMPGLPIEKLVESQRRNIEAVTEANRIALEGMQAIAQRQAEIAHEVMEECRSLVGELSTDASPEKRAARQLELTKEAMETALANARELAEMAAKSNSEAIDAINTRLCACLDEMRDAVTK